MFLRSFPDHWPSIFARTCRNDIVNRTPNAQKCDTDHIRPPRSFHISEIKRYFRLEKETRYDLDFGRRGRPILHNARYAACDVVDIHSCVRRALREPHADQGTIALDNKDCSGEIWKRRRSLTCPEGHTGHAVVTDV